MGEQGLQGCPPVYPSSGAGGETDVRLVLYCDGAANDGEPIFALEEDVWWLYGLNWALRSATWGEFRAVSPDAYKASLAYWFGPVTTGSGGAFVDALQEALRNLQDAEVREHLRAALAETPLATETASEELDLEDLLGYVTGLLLSEWEIEEAGFDWADMDDHALRTAARALGELAAGYRDDPLIDWRYQQLTAGAESGISAGFADDAPFDPSQTPGLVDADFPPQLDAVVETWMPAGLLDRYGRRSGDVLLGDRWRFPKVAAATVAFELLQRGFACRRDDHRVLIASGVLPLTPGEQFAQEDAARASREAEDRRRARAEERVKAERRAEEERRLAGPLILRASPGFACWIRPQELGVDDEGQLWVDPRIRPSTLGGFHFGDMRLEKQRDGTYRLSARAATDLGAVSRRRPDTQTLRIDTVTLNPDDSEAGPQ